VRRIADLLHLPIGVESELHRGASFFVVVPVGEAARVESLNTGAIAQPQNLAGLCVLVIDDDVAVRDSMRTLLSLWQCQVVTAPDAVQAITLAREAFGCPDALVVDYRLRDERNGTQAIALVRSEFQAEIPALIVSGDTAPKRLREVADSGHVLIHKPAPPAALRAFLFSALRAKQGVSNAS
jgi:two-component system, sensor histidine kinase